MSRYFDRDESIYNWMGEDVPRVLEVIANHYIGQNPPFPFAFHAYSRNGFHQLDDGRYDMNLQDKWPDARPGQWAYMYGMLWCESDSQVELKISSYSPTSVYLDGKLIYRSLVAPDTDVQAIKSPLVELHTGWNRFFIKTCRTRAGFGCVFGPAHKTWSSFPIVAPLDERMGQAGWVFSEVVDGDLFADHPVTGAADGDVALGLVWHPKMSWDAKSDIQACARIFGIQPGKTAYGWTELDVAGVGTQPHILQLDVAGATRIWIDGEPVSDHRMAGRLDLHPALAPGQHDLLIASTSGAHDWGWTVIGSDGISFRQPHPVKGIHDPWFYLGPFDAPLPCRPAEIQVLHKVFDNNGAPVYWRVDAPETWVRPYGENLNFGIWNYPLGVTLYGLLRTARMLGRQDVIDYVARHVGECVKWYPYSLYDRAQYGSQSINLHLVEMSCLDDCGSFGAATLESYVEKPSPESRIVADAIADYILNRQVRTVDGAFYRVKTMWIDDLYMSTPFLARYYRLTGNRAYIDDAARQFLLFKKYLYMPDQKIMSHIYDFGHDMATGVPWGRGNGWCLFSLSEVLEILPEDHPDRTALLAFFNDLCEGYLALQGEHGLWRQVLNDPEAYEETSCTAMFAYAFARGVRFGWLPEPAPYIEAVRKAWRGLTQISVDHLGNVHGVCRGSNYSFTPDYYKYELLWRTNDTHGIGIVMLAGVEAMKLDGWLRRDA